jgi:hypothetical protein
MLSRIGFTLLDEDGPDHVETVKIVVRSPEFPSLLAGQGESLETGLLIGPDRPWIPRRGLDHEIPHAESLRQVVAERVEGVRAVALATEFLGPHPDVEFDPPPATSVRPRDSLNKFGIPLDGPPVPG